MFGQNIWMKKLWQKQNHEEIVPANPLVSSHTHYVVNSVQAFICDRHITRTWTVAKDVADFLEQSNYIEIDPQCKKSINKALSSVQRFLLKIGYKRGKKKGMMCYCLKAENLHKRDIYAAKMTKLYETEFFWVVYIDESYIHKN